MEKKTVSEQVLIVSTNTNTVIIQRFEFYTRGIIQ